MKIKKVEVDNVYWVDLEDEEYGGKYYRDFNKDWWIEGIQLHWEDPLIKDLERLLSESPEFIY